jgi:nitrous oxide reductase
MPERTKRLSRRNFLLTAGAAGAATAAALVAKSPASTPASPEHKRVSRGYHATGHVNSYYRTTQV